jgi:hypothetical protein
MFFESPRAMKCHEAAMLDDPHSGDGFESDGNDDF